MKKSSRNYTLCEVTGGPVRRYGKTSKPLKPFPITAQRFATARSGCMLTIEQTAKLLRVSERTLHNWEAGRVRIPYAAYKLIRILRGYELPGDAWKGYRLVGDTLWSPENIPFHASDARWWSLTVQMAHEYRRQSKARQTERTAENGARAKVCDVRVVGTVPTSRAENGASASGLVSFTTSDLVLSKNQQKRGFQPPAKAGVLPLQRHYLNRVQPEITQNKTGGRS